MQFGDPSTQRDVTAHKGKFNVPNETSVAVIIKLRKKSAQVFLGNTVSNLSLSGQQTLHDSKHCQTKHCWLLVSHFVGYDLRKTQRPSLILVDLAATNLSLAL